MADDYSAFTENNGVDDHDPTAARRLTRRLKRQQYQPTYAEPKRNFIEKPYTGGKRRRAKTRGNRDSGGTKENSSSAAAPQKNRLITRHPRLLQFLNEARYEAYVDPYRGMVPYFSVSFGNNDGGSGDPSNGGGSDSIDSESPWRLCADVPRGGGEIGSGGGEASQPFPSPWQFVDPNAVGGDEDGDVAASGEENHRNDGAGVEVIELADDSDVDESSSGAATKSSDADADIDVDPLEILLRCGCPSVDSWTREEWERIDKLRAARTSAAAKKNGTGGRRGKKRPQNDAVNAVVVEENNGRRIAESGGSSSSPDHRAPSAAEKRVVCGRRRKDANFCCPCDFNPFCLASLGGAIEKYICQAASAKYLQNHPSRCSKGNGRHSDSAGVDNTQEAVAENGGGPKRPSTATSGGGVFGGKMATDVKPFPAGPWSRDDVGEADDEPNADDGCRKSSLVDAAVVRSHVAQFVCGGDDNSYELTMDTCVDKISTWHEYLLLPDDSCRFQNESKNGEIEFSASDANKIRLSLPPGLRNLGATCYLNSQFQCLAQNLVFLRGVLSWTKPKPSAGGFGVSTNAVTVENRMIPVLTTMQTILARMKYGPESVVCTNEFSEALSLENDEMQDPNEFTRLLFDRMQESFRCSSEGSRGDAFSSERVDLEDLLPTIYGGVCVYITTCGHCNKASERRENFMDLMVPIAEVNNDSRQIKSVNACVDSKHAALPSNSDVDVQQCLNSYLHPENLDGDNQYFCGKCDRKRDALRAVMFEKLPPVLNIQLARYVFDRDAHAKRKLSKKILLPTNLYIPLYSPTLQGRGSQKKQRRLESGVETEELEYVLCAVQNHLGNSAYGGHYVAEAMDWLTGVWYEFNDQDVTILEEGPTSSFEPFEAWSSRSSREKAAGTDVSFDDDSSPAEPSEGSKGQTKRIRGSTDAYNLFYVERRYLALKTKAELQRNATLMKCNGSTAVVDDDDETAVSAVNKQRIVRYQLESETRQLKIQTKARIRGRMEEIWDKLFPIEPILSLPSNDHCDGHVLVDSDILRRFFSFTDGMDDVFRNASESALLRHKAMLCKHSKGLHPKMARKGKLMTRRSYDILINILRHEHRSFFRDEEGLANFNLHPEDNDCLIINGRNLICDVCAPLHQQDIRRKYNALTTSLSLYEDLAPGNNELELTGTGADNDVYAISRAFVTNFRKYVERRVKFLTDDAAKKSSSVKSSCAGLDLLELNDLIPKSGGNPECWIDIGQEQSDTSSNDYLDVTVNSKITCAHGRCAVFSNLSRVRLIPSWMWDKVVKLFPVAIVHQPASRSGVAESEVIGNCQICYHDRMNEIKFPGKLEEWRLNTLFSPALSEANVGLEDLLRRSSSGEFNRHYPSDIEHALLLKTKPALSEQNLQYLVLHSSDVRSWRNAVGVAGLTKKYKKQLSDTKRKLWNFLFAGSDTSCGENVWKLRSLVCSDHNQALAVPVANNEFCSSETLLDWLECCRKCNLELLTLGEYSSLIYSISGLESLLCDGLCRDSEANPVINVDEGQVRRQVAFYRDGSSRFPSVSIMTRVCGHTESDVGVEFQIIIRPTVCNNGCTVAGMNGDGAEKDRLFSNRQVREVSSNEDGVIDINEEKDGDVVKLCIHTNDDFTSIEESVNKIISELAIVSNESSLRRSGRRRKHPGLTNHYVEMVFDGNLANLRLLIHQTSNKPFLGQRLFILCARPLFSSECIVVPYTELGNKDNTRTMREILGEVTSKGDDSCPLVVETEHNVHIMMTYIADEDDQGVGRSRKKRLNPLESREQEESIMFSLTEAACSGGQLSPRNKLEGVADGGTDDNKKGKRQKKCREERGFRGTFLQSLSEVSSVQEKRHESSGFHPTEVTLNLPAPSPCLLAITGSGAAQNINNKFMCVEISTDLVNAPAKCTSEPFEHAGGGATKDKAHSSGDRSCQNINSNISFTSKKSDYQSREFSAQTTSSRTGPKLNEELRCATHCVMNGDSIEPSTGTEKAISPAKSGSSDKRPSDIIIIEIIDQGVENSTLIPPTDFAESGNTPKPFQTRSSIRSKGVMTQDTSNDTYELHQFVRNEILEQTPEKNKLIDELINREIYDEERRCMIAQEVTTILEPLLRQKICKVLDSGKREGDGNETVKIIEQETEQITRRIIREECAKRRELNGDTL